MVFYCYFVNILQYFSYKLIEYWDCSGKNGVNNESVNNSGKGEGKEIDRWLIVGQWSAQIIGLKNVILKAG